MIDKGGDCNAQYTHLRHTAVYWPRIEKVIPPKFIYQKIYLHRIRIPREKNTEPYHYKQKMRILILSVHKFFFIYIYKPYELIFFTLIGSADCIRTFGLFLIRIRNTAENLVRYRSEHNSNNSCSSNRRYASISLLLAPPPGELCYTKERKQGQTGHWTALEFKREIEVGRKAKRQIHKDFAKKEEKAVIFYPFNYPIVNKTKKISRVATNGYCKWWK